MKLLTRLTVALLATPSFANFIITDCSSWKSGEDLCALAKVSSHLADAVDKTSYLPSGISIQRWFSDETKIVGVAIWDIESKELSDAEGPTSADRDRFRRELPTKLGSALCKDQNVARYIYVGGAARLVVLTTDLLPAIDITVTDCFATYLQAP